MGVESFYINVKLKKADISKIDAIMRSNAVYSEYINSYIDIETDEMCLQAAMVSFFPMCEIMFDFCSDVNKESQIISINTRNINHQFNFSSFNDFFNWIYDSWKEPLKNFRQEWGNFLVNPSDYYKTREKLRKKYYIKYQLKSD